MASQIALDYRRGLATAERNWGSDDMRVMLNMSNNNCATAALTAAGVNLDDYTLDESDDSGTYARQTVTEVAAAVDDGNNRVEMDVSDASIVFGSGDTMNGDATRNYTGCSFYVHVDGTAANDIFAIWVEFTSAINNTSTEVTITPDAEGIWQI